MPAQFEFEGESYLIHPQKGVSMQHNEDWYDMDVPSVVKLPDGRFVKPSLIEGGGKWTACPAPIFMSSFNFVALR